jgi:histidine triad (HIT) family protein
MDCIFCRILAGEIPGEVIAETADTLAFLDVTPLADGHVLVIPKTHARIIEALPAETAAALMQMAQRISAALCGELGAAGTTLGINNGPETGQTVPHVHLHIVPRFPGDGAGSLHSAFPGFASDPAPLAGTAKRLRDRIAQSPAAAAS